MSLTTKKSWEKHAFLTRSSSQDCKKQSKTKTHFNFRPWQVDVSSLIFAFPNRHQGDQYLKANHSRQTFLSKSKASDKRSHFIFVSVRWGSLTFYSAEKPLKEHLVWRTSHLGALWARSCLHSAVHIWRKLKQMKTNTSFLMLLLVMKHRCDAFRVPPQLSTPSSPLVAHLLRPLQRLWLNKIQTRWQWTQILCYSSYINQQWSFEQMGEVWRCTVMPEQLNI